MTVRSCTITTPLAPGKNRLNCNVAGVGRVKTKVYRNWISTAGKELMIQRPHRFLSPVALDVLIGLPSRQQFDLDGKLVAIQDLLTRHAVIQDDSWRFLPDIRVRIGAVQPGQAEITLRCLSRDIESDRAVLELIEARTA